MNTQNSESSGPSSDTVAGATGGTGGAVAGAALGSLAGPIGTIIGGLAGAVGGWWAGKSLADSPAFSHDDDQFYLTHHQTAYPVSDVPESSRPLYGNVRPAYQLGHLAGMNPDYQSHSFHDVEPHLERAYATAGQHEWSSVRQYAQDAWDRGRNRNAESNPNIPASRSGTRAGAGESAVDTPSTPLGDYGRKLRDDR